jgi:hypothetical protein
LPCPPSATKTERVYIEEREVYLAFAATTNEQKARKTANVDWLVERRKQLYTLMQDSSDAENKANGRSDRYRALCIATHHGDAYEQWADTHNKWGKAYTEDGVETSTGGVQTRSWFKAHCRSYLRISESPPGSNRGAPQPVDGEEGAGHLSRLDDGPAPRSRRRPGRHLVYLMPHRGRR